MSDETAEHIRNSIRAYGAHLIELPDECWSTSVYIWMGSYWDVLVDLWTQEEGASDLVLGAKMLEDEGGYSVEVHMVYVP